MSQPPNNTRALPSPSDYLTIRHENENELANKRSPAAETLTMSLLNWRWSAHYQLDTMTRRRESLPPSAEWNHVRSVFAAMTHLDLMWTSQGSENLVICFKIDIDLVGSGEVLLVASLTFCSYGLTIRTSKYLKPIVSLSKPRLL